MCVLLALWRGILAVQLSYTQFRVFLHTAGKFCKQCQDILKCVEGLEKLCSHYTKGCKNSQSGTRILVKKI
jgi:hypothetical protein